MGFTNKHIRRSSIIAVSVTLVAELVIISSLTSSAWSTRAGSAVDESVIEDTSTSISTSNEDGASITVVDSVPPTARPQNQIALAGEELPAEVFVTDINDATEVSVTYRELPDFITPGLSEVTVVLEDLGMNKVEVTASLYIFDIYPNVTVEAGSASINPLDYLVASDGIDELLDIINITIGLGVERERLDTPGEYDVIIHAYDRAVRRQYIVKDTTPPAATVLNMVGWQGRELDAAAFFTDINDMSAVSARYKAQPDFKALGYQDVSLVLEDEWGNSAQFDTGLTLKADTEPPVIIGVGNIAVHVGDSISYRAGVYAEDNADGIIGVSIDSSAVNLYQVGEYPVTYRAVDISGNETTRTIKVTVTVLSYDEVYSLADSVLSSITTPGMSLQEKARCIYDWVKRNIRYTPSKESDALSGAYYGFKLRQGDCSTFYAVSAALLTMAGIDNMQVTRVGGYTNHYWNLINVGTGWYHFDTSPTGVSGTFMFTSTQAEEFTKTLVGRLTNAYVYDKSLYPPVVGDANAQIGPPTGTPPADTQVDDTQVDDTQTTGEQPGETQSTGTQPAGETPAQIPDEEPPNTQPGPEPGPASGPDSVPGGAQEDEPPAEEPGADAAAPSGQPEGTAETEPEVVAP